MNENRAGESRQQAAATLSRAAARRGWGALFVLALLALAGNYFSLPLFFGVEFLFGSIFVLLAAHGLGASRGVLVALLAGLYTWLAWHHPYFLMVMLGEAIFVGLLLRRWRNILLLDGVFWVVLGMPLFYFLLRQMLRLDGLEAGVIVLKSAVNGIFNALMASLLIKHFPALAWPGRPRRARLISLRQAAFNIVVGCVLLPVFIFTIVECRRAKEKVESDLLRDVTQRARLIHGEMRGWKAQHLAVFSQIAKLMNDVPGAPQSAPASTRAADFQHDLALLAGTLPDALAIGIRDEKQREIATYAANENARRALEDFQAGQRAPGAESANRLPGDFIYSFWSAPDERLAQGASGTLHQAFRVPIRDASGAFRGHVFALVSRDELQSILNRELLGSNEKATIVDRSNRVLASTRAGQTPFSVLSFDASRAEKGRVVAVDPNTFQLFPAADSPPITRWKNSSLIHVIAARDSAWKIVVEAPFAAQQRRLQELYFNNLALMLALCIAALFLASLVSRALTKPLSELARVTHNLPQRLMSDAALESIRWPDSRLDQMQALIGNFKEMSFNLRANFRDVASTRARLEEEQARLQEASRLKDEFLAIVSHELRTPLVPVIGYADLLARGMLKNEEDRIEATRAIERNARIQLRLIEDLLDVSRSAAGQMRIEVEPVELAEVVRESVANVQLAAQAKEIEILCEIAPDVPPISGDRSRLAQVMWNLLTNALKFTPPGGRVHVVLSREEKCAVIAVRDDGRGIDADFLPHVFARFRQAGSHLTRQEGGMGLGLSIVHDIVQLHGGTIEAHSDGEGRGAAFIVKFPLHATPQSPENPGASFNLSA